MTTKMAMSRRGAVQAMLGVVATAPLLGRAGSAPALAAPSTRSPEAMLDTLTDGIFINANESPLGPCAGARAALERTPPLAGRYGMRFAGQLERLFAQQNGLKPENVTVHPGSYVPLRNAALAYAKEGAPLAYATPTFDAGFFGAAGKPIVPIVKIAVDEHKRINLRALHAAAPNAGAYYVCNPNNPTGLVTSLADIEWLLASKPAHAKLIIDEAYIHFSDAKSALPLVAAGADVIVLRTFSKIYGLAGLRIGLVAARKDLLDGMLDYGVNIPPMPAVVAAEASLLDPAVLAQRKAYNAAVRDDLFAFFRKQGLEFLPSQACFTMVKVGRPGEEIAKAMAAQGVHISGSREGMPDWVRVSFGSPEEMARFKSAFVKVLAA